MSVPQMPGVGDLDLDLVGLGQRFGDLFDLDEIDGFLNCRFHRKYPRGGHLAPVQTGLQRCAEHGGRSPRLKPCTEVPEARFALPHRS